jgi:hypothetical protein
MRNLIFLFGLTLASTEAAMSAGCKRSLPDLGSLFLGTNGPQWSDNTGWNDPSADCCSWYGIQCRDGEIVSIDLRNNNLVAKPDDFPGGVFNQMPMLEYIALSANDLGGNVIPDLRFNPNLKNLEMKNCNLKDSTGAGWFGSNWNLESIVLGGNGISGSLPNFYNNSNMKDIELGENLFEGNIPDWSHLTKLDGIYVENNPNIKGCDDFNTPGNINDMTGCSLSGIPFSCPLPNWMIANNCKATCN